MGCFVLVITLSGCGSQNSSLDTDQNETGTIGQDSQEIIEYFDTSTQDTRYFEGYPCTQDCSGHEAGYNWAEENGIESVDDCGGKSNSFIEGCQSYVEENF